MKAASPQPFRFSAGFVNQSAPFIHGRHVCNEVAVTKGCSLGAPGGAAGIYDQGQVFTGLDFHGRRTGSGGGNRIVEVYMICIVAFRLGDLAQKGAENALELGKVGLDIAVDDGLHVRILDSLACRRIEFFVVHAENRFGARVLQLVV